MSGIIYIITTGDEAYVGSTRDFKQRMRRHKHNLKVGCNCKLYKTIRENNGEWDMCIYEDNLAMSKEELYKYEDEVMELLGATLNSQRAYTSQEQLQEQIKKNVSAYYVKNKKFLNEKHRRPVDCECGCVVSYGCLSRHKKGPKHIKRMISLEQNAKAELPRRADSE